MVFDRNQKPMVFDRNPTHFIPVISEKLKFENLIYVQKNDKNVTKLHFYPQHCLIQNFHARYVLYTRQIVTRLSTF